MTDLQLFAIIFIGLLAIIIITLQTHYFWQVGFMRIFFRSRKDIKQTKPKTAYIKNVIKLKDKKYGSVLGHEYLDFYFLNNMSDKRPLLIWVHGGGYISGDKACADEWARELVARCNIRVASINYTTAPEQHYPVAVVQTGEAIKYLLSRAEKYGINRNKIFMAGDSAGAQIVSQYASIVTNKSLASIMGLRPALKNKQLSGIGLFCGFYNFDSAIKSGFPAIKTFLWAYTNCKKLKTFKRKDELSSIKYITENYPDTFITCGNRDKFYDEAVAMKDALIKCGVRVDSLLDFPKGTKLFHEYQFNLKTDLAQLALDRFSEFILARTL